MMTTKKILKTGLSLTTVLLLTLVACKEKKKEPAEKLWPVLPYLNSQVAGIDTSLFSIVKYVFVDSTRTDTIFINREQFRQAAVDFLSLPDISSKDYDGRFKEFSEYNNDLGKVMITHLPVDASKELIQRQELLIKPDPTGDKVTTIIINTSVNNKDSSVQKKMLWQIDKSFQVTSIRQLPGQPETIITYKVVWE